jgi:hypothetical protein
MMMCWMLILLLMTIKLSLSSSNFISSIKHADNNDNDGKSRLEALTKYIFTHFGFENGMIQMFFY